MHAMLRRSHDPPQAKELEKYSDIFVKPAPPNACLNHLLVIPANVDLLVFGT